MSIVSRPLPALMSNDPLPSFTSHISPLLPQSLNSSIPKFLNPSSLITFLFRNVATSLSLSVAPSLLGPLFLTSDV